MMEASIFIIVIISLAILPMINAEGEKYNLPEKVCPDYGGKWDDEKEICKIEDTEEKAAYEDYVCDDPDNSLRYPKVCQ